MPRRSALSFPARAARRRRPTLRRAALALSAALVLTTSPWTPAGVAAQPTPDAPAARLESGGVSLQLPAGWAPLPAPATTLPALARTPGFRRAAERRDAEGRHALLVLAIVPPERAPSVTDDPDDLLDYINRVALAVALQPGVEVTRQDVVAAAPGHVGLLAMTRSDAALLDAVEVSGGRAAVEQLNLVRPTTQGLVEVFLYRPVLEREEDAELAALLAGLRTPPRAAPAPAAEPGRSPLGVLALTGGLLLAAILGLRLYMRTRRRGADTVSADPAARSLARARAEDGATPTPAWEEVAAGSDEASSEPAVARDAPDDSVRADATPRVPWEDDLDQPWTGREPPRARDEDPERA